MKRMLAMVLCLVAGTLAAQARWAWNQQATSEAMASAARAFLDALDPEQRKLAALEFDDPNRLDWHFVPRERKGLALGDMAEPQRKLARTLFKTALSVQGLSTCDKIGHVEGILQKLESRPGAPATNRDPGRYFVTIFGSPDANTPWAWRAEGHHISLNFTLVPNRGIAVTPKFFGAHPALIEDTLPEELRELDDSPNDRRVLGKAEDLGRDLFLALSEEQRAAATLPGETPRDVILAPSREASLLEPTGLSAKLMDAKQRWRLQLLVLYALRDFEEHLAASVRERILSEEGEELFFAWSGSVEPGKAHYHRVQSSKFVLEFDHAAGDPNHVHTVFRMVGDDFGADLLRLHYEQSHRDR
jgi:uncharacterized protein DUF3500